MNNSNWHIEDFDLKLVKQIAEEFSLPQSIAKIMSLRGIIDRDISSNFFYPNKQKLHDPYLLKDMDKAVDALIKHINEKKKIMIYGDYDVDGVSSTSMLYNFFKSIDVDVSYYIPHRDIDGYGLSNRGIDFAKSIGASLIITCDCGINAFSQIEYAKNIEINVIVTDHHKPEDNIPQCLAALILGVTQNVICPIPILSILILELSISNLIPRLSPCLICCKPKCEIILFSSIMGTMSAAIPRVTRSAYFHTFSKSIDSLSESAIASLNATPAPHSPLKGYEQSVLLGLTTAKH